MIAARTSGGAGDVRGGSDLEVKLVKLAESARHRPGLRRILDEDSIGRESRPVNVAQDL